MAMGTHGGDEQRALFIRSSDLRASPGHPFYQRLNRLLTEHGFDRFAEERCARFYAATMGRPSLPPGVYFRMLMVGVFEGLGSERGIAWRCADSRSLGEFLGFGPTEATPDHTTLSKIRQRLDVEAHREVFGWVLALLAEHGVVKGSTLGVDSSTLEANAAMRSIVARADGQSYEAFLAELARSSGIATPSRADCARLDKRRPKKGSNDDWTHPHDPDARITRMKDGRTHLAHKVEHAVDLDGGAIVGVTVQPADRGDTTSVFETLTEAVEQLQEAVPDGAAQAVVLDKGFHSDDVLVSLAEVDLTGYVSEPQRPRRRWRGRAEAQRAVYANRRRIQGRRGKALLARRGELVERSFAHAYETGGLRRLFVRGRDEITKRVLGAALTVNLMLLMRTLHGVGTPRGLQGRLLRALETSLHALIHLVSHTLGPIAGPLDECGTPTRQAAAA
jgi:transposase